MLVGGQKGREYNDGEEQNGMIIAKRKGTRLLKTEHNKKMKNEGSIYSLETDKKNILK